MNVEMPEGEERIEGMEQATRMLLNLATVNQFKFSGRLTGCVEMNEIKHTKNAIGKKQMCSPFL